MATIAQAVVIMGIFTDTDQANRAVEQLYQAGFRKEEIGIVAHREMFTFGGIAEEDVLYYQSALEAGYIIVTVQAGNRATQVERVFHDNGAYDATTRVDIPRWRSIATYPDDHGIQGASIPYGTHR